MSAASYPSNVNASTTTDGLVVFEWDTTSLSDGEYQVQGLTECNNFVYSQPTSTLPLTVLKHSFTLFGVPQPVDTIPLDGVISARFSSNIDCVQAFHTGSMKLAVVTGVNGSVRTTNDLDAIVKCKDDTIEMALGVQVSPKTIAGANLGATVASIQDVAGNPLEAPAVWYFQGTR